MKLIALFALLSIVSVQAIAQDKGGVEAKAPGSADYKIIRDEKTPGVERSVAVRLREAVSADSLATLAERIRATDGETYERVLIRYYLPYYSTRGMGWASAHFTPEIEVRIQGVTATEAAARAQSEAEGLEKRVIGIWLEELTRSSRRIELFREQGKLFMTSIFSDSSSVTGVVKEQPTGHGLRFKLMEGTMGEYYMILPNGDLEIWDGQGLIRVIGKIE